MDEQTASGRQFHLKTLVGHGAFGEVYLAEQDSGAGFRRKVAIKLLHAQVAEMSRDAGRRMRDEARILGRLSHRNIVTVLDLVKLGERWAIIMDYVPGADLEEVLHALETANEKFPGPAALEVGAAVLNALDAAFHSDDGAGGQLGVIHRDIKPSNVRLTTDGEVKVLDFGVARVNMDTREAMTRASGWIGTERYMAPERILCEGDGPEGDVYAAVASVVELLNGEPLGRTPVLPEKHAPFVEAALAQSRAALDGPDDVVDEVVEWLRRGLHADPAARPGPRELSDAMAQLSRRLHGEGVIQFSRRFMGRVDELLQRAPEPVSGTLSEHTSAPKVAGAPVNPTLSPRTGDSATFDPDHELFDAPEPKPVAEPAAVSIDRTTLIRGGAVAGVAALLVGLLGVAGVIGAVVLASGGTEATTEPTPAPVVVAPAPAPEPAPPPVAPEPVEVAAPSPEPAEAPAPAPGTADAAPAPTPRPAAPAPAPAAAPTGPPVKNAKVILENASSITVKCGDVTANGTTSALIRNFPAGTCTINAVYVNASYATTAVIDRAREVHCAIEGDKLTCG